MWERAVIFCPETADAIAALPKKLRALAADEQRIARMRAAMAALWQMYGDGHFVHDIEQLVRNHVSPSANASTLLAADGAKSTANDDTGRQNWRSLQAVTTALLLDPAAVQESLANGLDLSGLFASASGPQRELFRRAAALRNLTVELAMQEGAMSTPERNCSGLPEQ